VIDLLRAAALLLAAAAGAGVVLTRDPLAQAMVVSFLGIVLALLFLLYQAPDVALSQVVVGAVALPLMILLTLAKVRRDAEEKRRAGARRRTGT
jgi:energy-converting hydrogenase B subunit D